MDTRMETVESNIGNLDNSVNLMAHMLKQIMQEIKQGNNIAPANVQSNTQERKEENTTTDNNTTVTEDTSLSDQSK